MKKLALTFATALVAALSLGASKAQAFSHSRLRPETQTVKFVDLQRYVGTWYAIASQPTSYEHDCFCSRQVVTPSRVNAGGEITKLKIQMSCNRYSAQGKYDQINLNATNVDPSTNAKLRATYNVFVKIDYWVIGLAQDYSWAVLTNPSGSMLYIISKTPQLAADKYAEALKVAAEQRDISQLKIISHEGCSYPFSL